MPGQKTVGSQPARWEPLRLFRDSGDPSGSNRDSHTDSGHARTLPAHAVGMVGSFPLEDGGKTVGLPLKQVAG